MSPSTKTPQADLRNPDRWDRCKEIIGTMLDLDRSSWPTHLSEHCGDDVDLFFDAACLARFSTQLDDFLEEPAWRRVLP